MSTHWPSRQKSGWPSKEERDKRRELTISRIRALTGDQAKDLLEDLIARNEFTGICLHACEFVDKVAMETTGRQAEIAQQVEHMNPKLKFVDSVGPGAARYAYCGIGSLSPELVARSFATAFESGTLAWDRFEEDETKVTAIVRVVSAQ